MDFSRVHLADIPHIISEPRFATYLRHCNNDREKALRLYQWNLEISSAYVVPLHLLEVSVRNAVVEALEKVHTSNWPWTQGFVRSLPNSRQGYNPRKNLNKVAIRQPTVGKVVAELNFVFWEKMFTSRHDSRIWDAHIQSSFPHASMTLNAQQIRAHIHNDIRDIRQLRNRIAHYEPIFSRNLKDDYEKIHRLVSWRCQTTSDWLDEIQTVTKLIEQKPTP